jgi:hypothetical protein|eukprot:COSAG01_NODE_3057_length_6657_cov_3.725526_2_plen_40_part_00
MAGRLSRFGSSALKTLQTSLAGEEEEADSSDFDIYASFS